MGCTTEAGRGRKFLSLLFCQRTVYWVILPQCRATGQCQMLQFTAGLLLSYISYSCTTIDTNVKGVLNTSVMCGLTDHIRANQTKISPKITSSLFLVPCSEKLEFSVFFVLFCFVLFFFPETVKSLHALKNGRLVKSLLLHRSCSVDPDLERCRCLQLMVSSSFLCKATGACK